MSREVMEHDAMSCDMTYMLYHMMMMSGDDMSCDGDGDVMAMSLQEEDGYTGLHHAAKQGNLQLVHLLLETGQVDINAQVRWETVSVATTGLQTAASGFPISRVDQLAINSF
jgi:hypothetical protein